MWDIPGPGLEPVSPALAGGFLTTAPPGKSQSLAFSAFRAKLRSLCVFNQLLFLPTASAFSVAGKAERFTC